MRLHVSLVSLSIVALCATPQQALSADYRLLHRTPKTIQFLDIETIASSHQRTRRVELISVQTGRVASSEGAVAQYDYEVDCRSKKIRGLGYTIFAPNLKAIKSIRKKSKWRSSHLDLRLKHDVGLYCSGEGLKKLTRMPGDKAVDVIRGIMARAPSGAKFT